MDTLGVYHHLSRRGVAAELDLKAGHCLLLELCQTESFYGKTKKRDYEDV